MAKQPLVDQSLLITEASWSHSDTPQSVTLLWTSDQPTQWPLPDKTQHSQQTDIHAPGTFEPAIPESEHPQTHALDRTDTGIGIQNSIAL